jgi:hypothetical protein
MHDLPILKHLVCTGEEAAKVSAENLR